MQAGQEVSPEPPEVEGETPAPGRWEAQGEGLGLPGHRKEAAARKQQSQEAVSRGEP